MPRVLVIRYEGQPFHVRMSKVLRTILDSGWTCDVLIPENGLTTINVSREMGRDLTNEVQLLEFPRRQPRTYLERGARRLLDYFGSRHFTSYLTDLLSTQHYDLIWVKDTPLLAAVFRCIERAQHPQVRVVCDMYENMTEQVYDQLFRFGKWFHRVIGRVSFLIQRVRNVEKKYLPLCDRIFVVVEETKAFLVRRYDLDPSRITVVHNVEILADYDQIEPGPLPIDESLPLISFVGGFAPFRGIETLLEAVAILFRRGEDRFQLGLVGALPRDIALYGGMAKELGIEHLVHLHGMLPHRDAMRWMKQSNIGVIPHMDTPQIRTTIPNKLFQYMAAGVPVIVSDVGPLSRIVRKAESGLVFKAGDAEGLAEHISTLLSSAELRHRLGANGRASCEQLYSWEVEGQRYSRYLQDVASSVYAATEGRPRELEEAISP